MPSPSSSRAYTFQTSLTRTIPSLGDLFVVSFVTTHDINFIDFNVSIKLYVSFFFATP